MEIPKPDKLYVGGEMMKQSSVRTYEDYVKWVETNIGSFYYLYRDLCKYRTTADEVREWIRYWFPSMEETALTHSSYSTSAGMSFLVNASF